MTQARSVLPSTAVAVVAVTVFVLAVADPVGLLAPVGWSGGSFWPDGGWWAHVTLLVYVPVLLAVTWWAVRAVAPSRGLFGKVFLSVLLASGLGKAAASTLEAGDLWAGLWASSYSLAKALPMALVAATAVVVVRRIRASRVDDSTVEDETVGSGDAVSAVDSARRLSAVGCGALVFAAVAPLSTYWWTAPVYTSLTPTPSAALGWGTAVSGVLVLAVSIVLAGRMRRPLDAGSMPRSASVLDGWFVALVGAAIAAVIGAAVGLVTGDGFAGDMWPLMALYVRMADMVSFAVCFGWIVGLAVLVRPGRVWLIAAAIGAVVLVVVGSLTGQVVREAVVAAPIKTDRPAPLQVDGTRIVDDQGRDVLLRGVNVNQLVDFYAKRPEVPSTTPLTAADFEQIASYGFNVVRLGISWSALEPTRGEYDDAYLQQIRTAVDQAADVGMYTVIDMHQDGWSAAPTPDGETCRPGTEPMWGYDGAPAWATIDDGAPRCQFTGRDISPAGDRAFENFYHDTDGVQDRLVRAWGRLGEEFGDDPAVAGFDLLNEPGFGESAPVTTTALLGRYYGRAIDALRGAGARQMVFFEPSLLWSGMAFESTVPADFTRDGNIVFAPHLYAESITMDRSLGLPPFVGIERGFELAARVSERLGVPLWSGEYGYWGDDRIGRLTRYAAAEDEYRIGGVYWVWKQSCGDPQNGIGPIGDGLIPQDCVTGEFRAPDREVIDVLSRAYPRRTPGRLESLVSQGRSMTMTGSGHQQGCDLEVWVPGAGAPTISSTGVTDVRVRALGAGQVITGCAKGGFELATS